MSEDHALSADLKGTEALLAALRPQAPTIDRDRLMYEAGVASGRRAPLRFGLALRSVATIAGLAASLLLGMWIGDQRTVEVEHFIGRRKAEQQLPPVDLTGSTDAELAAPHDSQPLSLSPDSYLALRKHLAVPETAFATLPQSDGDTKPDVNSSLRRQQADWLQSLN